MPTGLAAAGLAPAGVYRPRRPLASPLHRLLSDHFDRFRGRYEDMFERRFGRWRWAQGRDRRSGDRRRWRLGDGGDADGRSGGREGCRGLDGRSEGHRKG